MADDPEAGSRGPEARHHEAVQAEAAAQGGGGGGGARDHDRHRVWTKLLHGGYCTSSSSINNDLNVQLFCGYSERCKSMTFIVLAVGRGRESAGTGAGDQVGA